VADLIDAVSESAVQAAGRSLSGEFSNAVRDVDGNITELRAFIEATLDFPEEDIDVIGSEKVRTRLVQAETGIRAILENARQGQVLREGVTVAIVGSPNVGKSSLLNRLTNADVLAYDKLFATLDSTTRKFELPEGREITVSDTVGFIQKLPTTLVEAFKSTLDEITGADLILHVIDASSEEREAQQAAVEDVLGQIGAQGIDRIEVYNKVDLLDEAERQALASRYPDAQIVSAETGQGIDRLIERIAQAASSRDERLEVVIPYGRGDLVSVAHERCHILSEEHGEDGTRIVMLAAPAYAGTFKQFAV